MFFDSLTVKSFERAIVLSFGSGLAGVLGKRSGSRVMVPSALILTGKFSIVGQIALNLDDIMVQPTVGFATMGCERARIGVTEKSK